MPIKYLLILFFLLSNNSFSGQVRPHFTKRGKFVSQHQRSNPNKTKLDNWSTKGNVNPYNGKKGKEK